MNRKEFNSTLLSGITSYALLDTLFAFNALAKAVQPIATHWAIQLNEYCRDLQQQTISPLEWQQSVERLFEKIELPELLKFIDFKQLSKGFQFPDLGVHTRPVQLPKLGGLPKRTAFIKKLFGMQKGRAIIPHGHSNMVSAHLVVKGDLHLRHYEKLHQEDNNLIIQPTIDKLVHVGDASSISDERDNVHWFVANSSEAFTFDVILVDLDGKSYDIHNLDMFEKQDLPDGSMRVPILDVDTALKKYGKQSHH